MKRTAVAAAAMLCLAVPAVALLAVPADAGTSKSLPGTTCPAFPANDFWHADVSRLPVWPRSAQWLSHMAPTSKLHPDFGPSYGAQSVPYGIPITYVTSSHAKVPVTFDYASESDRIGYPLGNDTKVEGGQMTSGDRHAVVVDKSTCTLYETWATRKSGTRWYAGSGAHWSLKSNALRPAGWTSADAAGLPILPGLLRYDEVAAGRVDHAIRFTTNHTDRHYMWPARHQAGDVSDLTYPRMGARFRLKASFSTARYRPDTRAVLTAMKSYGLVLADNGSPWYFQGAQDTRWAAAMLDELKAIPANAFEAVDTRPMMVSSNSGQAR
ncbi:MAG: hypothetical protein JWO27_1970 [Frankiales bacterium]|nr:hypothetical protein [Frankiales bacterium]